MVADILLDAINFTYSLVSTSLKMESELGL